MYPFPTHGNHIHKFFVNAEAHHTSSSSSRLILPMRRDARIKEKSRTRKHFQQRKPLILSCLENRGLKYRHQFYRSNFKLLPPSREARNEQEEISYQKVPRTFILAVISLYMIIRDLKNLIRRVVAVFQNDVFDKKWLQCRSFMLSIDCRPLARDDNKNQPIKKAGKLRSINECAPSSVDFPLAHVGGEGK